MGPNKGGLVGRSGEAPSFDRLSRKLLFAGVATLALLVGFYLLTTRPNYEPFRIGGAVVSQEIGTQVIAPSSAVLDGVAVDVTAVAGADGESLVLDASAPHELELSFDAPEGALSSVLAVSLSIPVATAAPEATAVASVEPSVAPTEEATVAPTIEATAKPEALAEPVASPEPTSTPAPSVEPTATPAPTVIPTPEPTLEPSPAPTATPEPTLAPTAGPTAVPEPTPAPTVEPTAVPSSTPVVVEAAGSRLFFESLPSVMVDVFVLQDGVFVSACEGLVVESRLECNLSSFDLPNPVRVKLVFHSSESGVLVDSARLEATVAVATPTPTPVPEATVAPSAAPSSSVPVATVSPTATPTSEAVGESDASVILDSSVVDFRSDNGSLGVVVVENTTDGGLDITFDLGEYVGMPEPEPSATPALEPTVTPTPMVTPIPTITPTPAPLIVLPDLSSMTGGFFYGFARLLGGSPATGYAVADATVTPTPEPIATPTVEPTATPLPTSTPTSEPSIVSSEVPSATPTPEATATPTPEPPAEPTAAVAPAPEVSVAPEATAAPTPAPDFAAAPEPTPIIPPENAKVTLKGVTGSPRGVVARVAVVDDAEVVTKAFGLTGGLSFDYATLMLPKLVGGGAVNRVVRCDGFDFSTGECAGSWVDAGVSFNDLGGAIEFNVTHFSAYAGSYYLPNNAPEANAFSAASLNGSFYNMTTSSQSSGVYLSYYPGNQSYRHPDGWWWMQPIRASSGAYLDQVNYSWYETPLRPLALDPRQYFINYSGIVGDFPFDGNCSDITGSLIPANCNSSASDFTTSYAQLGTAFLNRGSSVYDNATNAINLTGNVSISVWIVPWPNYYLIGIFKGTNVANSTIAYGIHGPPGAGSNNFTTCAYAGNATGAQFVCTTRPLKYYAAQHVGMVFNGTGLTIYSQGLPNASLETAVAIGPVPGPLYLGKDASFAGGGIDAAHIWNRALSDAEMYNVFVQEANNTNATSRRNPVLAMQFENDTKDISRYNNTGSFIGSPVYAAPCQRAGCYNYSLGGGITVASSDSLNPPENFSVSAWVFTNASGALQAVLSKPGSYFLGLNANNTVNFTVFGLAPTTVQSLAAVQNDAWTRIQGDYRTGNLSVYINGGLEDSAAATGSPAVGGADVTIASPFAGAIDELTAYNVSMAPSEIASAYLIEAQPGFVHNNTNVSLSYRTMNYLWDDANLSAWWRMGDTYDSALCTYSVTQLQNYSPDLSGNGNTAQYGNGTLGTEPRISSGLMSMPVLSSGTSSVRIPYYFDSPALRQVITVNDSPSLHDFDSDFTIAMWVYSRMVVQPDDPCATGGSGNTQRIFNRSLASKALGAKGWSLGVNNSGNVQFFVGDGTGIDSVNSTGIATGQVFFIVAGRNGSDIFVYLNGTGTTIASTRANTTNDGPLLFGDNNFSAALFKQLSGGIYDAKLWKRALSAQEIGELYNGGGPANNTGQDPLWSSFSNDIPASTGNLQMPVNTKLTQFKAHLYNYYNSTAITPVLNALNFSYRNSTGASASNLTGCAVLSTPDSAYSLDENLSVGSGYCLSVTAPNVTVDCRGYYIVGGTAGTSLITFGINDSAGNITIKDCNFYNLTYAVWLANSSQSNLSNLSFSFDANALYFSGGSINLSDLNISVTTGSAFGFIGSSQGNNLTNITAYSASGYGIRLLGNGNNSLVNVTASTSGAANSYGIYIRSNYNELNDTNASFLLDGADYSRFTNTSGSVSTSSGYNDYTNFTNSILSYLGLRGWNDRYVNTTLNCGSGCMSSTYGGSNVFINTTITCASTSYTSACIYIGNDGGSNVFNNTNITNTASGGYGIAIYDTSGYGYRNVFSNTTVSVTGSNSYGIYLYGAGGVNNSFTNTTVTTTAGYAIYAANNWNNFTNLNASATTGYAVFLSLANYSRFTETNATATTGYAVYLSTANDSVFTNTNATATTGTAIFLYSGSANNSFNGTYANATAFGIRLFGSSGNRFVDANASTSTGNAFYLEKNSSNNTFTNVLGNATGTNGVAVGMAVSFNNTFTNLTANATGANARAASIYFGVYNRIISSALSSQSGAAVVLNATAASNSFSGNNITSGGGAAAYLFNKAVNNSFDSNNISASNAFAAVMIGNATGQNTASNNSANFTNDVITCTNCAYSLVVNQSSNASLVNVSLNFSNASFGAFAYPGRPNWVNVSWFARANVTSSSGAALAGWVNLTDSRAVPVFEGWAGADGLTTWAQFNEWFGNSTSNASYLPLSVRASNVTCYAEGTAYENLSWTGTVNVSLPGQVVGDPPSVSLSEPTGFANTTNESVGYWFTPVGGVCLSSAALYYNRSGVWQVNNSYPGVMQNNTPQRIYVNGTASGRYLWNVQVCAGAVCAFALANRTVTVDYGAPSVLVSGYSNASYYNSNASFPVAALVSDGLVGLENGSCAVNLNGASNVSVAYNGSWCNSSISLSGLVDGNRTLRVYANDSLGNQALNDSFAIQIDNTVPVAYNSSVNDSLVWTNDSVLLSGNVTDLGGVLYAVWLESNFSGSWLNYSITTSPASSAARSFGGLFNYSLNDTNLSNHARVGFRFWANDSAGNENDSGMLVFVVANIGVPNGSLLTGPDNGSFVTASNATLNWTAATDIDNDTITYQVQSSNASDFSVVSLNSSGLTGADFANDGVAGAKINASTVLQAQVWRVRAYDGEEYGAWSDVRNMTVVSAIIRFEVANNTIFRNGSSYNLSAAEIEGAEWMNNATCSTVNRSWQMSPDGNWYYVWLANVAQPAVVRFTARAYNQSMNDSTTFVTSTRDIRVLKPLGVSRPPVMRFLCANETFVANGSNVSVRVGYLADSLWDGDWVSVTAPGGGVYNLTPEGTQVAGLNVFRNYSFIANQSGVFNVTGFFRDAENQSVNSTERFWVVPGLVRANFTVSGWNNASETDACGNIISRGQVVSYLRPPGKVNLSAEAERTTVTFHDLNLSSNASLELNYSNIINTSLNVSAPSRYSRFAQFEVNSSINQSETPFEYALVEFDYSLFVGLVNESRLWVFKCSNHSNCSNETMENVSFSVNTTSKVITVNVSSFSIFTLTEEDAPADDGSSSPTATPAPTATPVTNTVYVGGGGAAFREIPVEKKVEVIKSIDLLSLPGFVTVYSNDSIAAPIIIQNKESFDFNGVSLSAASDSPEHISMALSKGYFDVIPMGEHRIVNLTLATHSPPGRYNVTITASVQQPVYNQTIKLYVDLVARPGESKTAGMELLVFARDLFRQNPECLDLTEFLKRADAELAAGNYEKARQYVQMSVDSCRDLIALKRVKPVEPAGLPGGIGVAGWELKDYVIVLLAAALLAVAAYWYWSRIGSGSGRAGVRGRSRAGAQGEPADEDARRRRGLYRPRRARL